MARLKETIRLTFDDVLLMPGKSLPSRNTAEYGHFWPGLGDVLHPIIPANMDTISGINMCRAQLKSGGIAICHRFESVDGRIHLYRELRDEFNRGTDTGEIESQLELKGVNRLFISVGVNENDYIQQMYDAGIRNFCIDIAHGHADTVRWTILKIKSYVGTNVIAGNVATIEGFKFLAETGADIIKVGIGPGSHCTTRIVTGCGVPQLSAIMDIARVRNQHYPSKIIIGDGGLKNSGDITKALAAGADLVMTGSLVAGTDEAPGDIISWKDKSKWKVYRGMASKDAQVGWKSDMDPELIVAEGESSLVPYRGPFASRLYQLLGGLSSGMSYVGAESIKELQEKAVFVRTTANAVYENGAHGTKA